MKRYVPGEVVFLLFPFVNPGQSKRRPALVLIDTGDEDVIVARITSRENQKTIFDVELAEWQRIGLLFPSRVRLNKIATLEKRLVERSLGRVAPSDWKKIRGSLRKLWSFSLSF